MTSRFFHGRRPIRTGVAILLLVLLATSCVAGPSTTPIPTLIPTGLPTSYPSSTLAEPSPTTPPSATPTALPTPSPADVSEGFHAVPDAQTAVWRTAGTISSDTDVVPLVAWIDPTLAGVVEQGGFLRTTPVDPDADLPLRVGLLVLSMGNGTTRSVELVPLVLSDKDGVRSLSPNASGAASAPAIGDLFRMINSTDPITEAEANDTSHLQTFDPTPWAASGMTPFRLQPVCIPPLLSLLKAATDDGIVNAVVRTTYRNYTYQQSLFDADVAKFMAQGMTRAQAETATETTVARPGTSEHHGGYTLDTSSVGDAMNPSLPDTPYGAWLKAHCWDYGFILRYPKGKEAITTKAYEPWHIRYVGLPTSLLLRDTGFVLEEFHSALVDRRFLAYRVPADATQQAGDTVLYLRVEDPGPLSLPGSLSTSPHTVLSKVGDGGYVLMVDLQDFLTR